MGQIDLGCNSRVAPPLGAIRMPRVNQVLLLADEKPISTAEIVASARNIPIMPSHRPAARSFGYSGAIHCIGQL